MPEGLRWPTRIYITVPRYREGEEGVPSCNSLIMNTINDGCLPAGLYGPAPIDGIIMDFNEIVILQSSFPGRPNNSYGPCTYRKNSKYSMSYYVQNDFGTMTFESFKEYYLVTNLKEYDEEQGIKEIQKTFDNITKLKDDMFNLLDPDGLIQQWALQEIRSIEENPKEVPLALF